MTVPMARTSDRDDAPLGALFRDAEPERRGAVERRVGLNGVLARVLGRARAEVRVGHYVVEGKVGEGGMGVVYAGRSSETGERVAIKLIERGDGSIRRRFEREAALLKSLSDPRIVRYLEHGTSDDGTDYLVMEWLEGHDLGRALRPGPLSVLDALLIGIEAARGLDVAHRAGVVHRDVKPTNLFLVGQKIEALKVIDFGVARQAGGSTRLTTTGAVLGTPAYMAPEQLHGRADSRTDVYALGATLFQCLAGRPPFAGDNPGAVLVAVMAEPVPSLVALRPDVPTGLELLITRMLAKDPADRPVDMAAVITELSDLAVSPASRRRRPVISRVERVPLPAEPEPQAQQGTEIFGRARELALLSGLAAECEEEHVAKVALVSADDGLGRTHLVRCFGRDPGRAGRVVEARSTPDRVGVPFATFERLIDAIGASDPGPELRAKVERVTALLGETRTPVSRDAGRLADLLRLEWLELCDRWLTVPRVVVIDDAHWADPVSWRFVRRALAYFADRPLCVIATTRPGRPESELAAGIAAEQLVPLPLGPLGPRSALRLCRAKGPKLERSVLERLVTLAAGSPARLLELVRAQATGRLLAPGSLANISWDAVTRLDADSRRFLRAAAVVGGVFWLELVAELLGQRPEALTPRVELLLGAGLLRRGSGQALAGTTELEFESELTRLALLQLCTESELEDGHRTAASWLGARPKVSPALIAEHHEKAGDLGLAAPYWLRAAHAAVAGDDAEALARFVEAGLRCEPPPELGARFEALSAESAFWRGELAQALEVATRALESLAPGSVEALRLSGLCLTAAGQLGKNDEVARVLERVAETPAAPGAEDERITCLCRGISQQSALDAAKVERFVAEVFQESAGRVLGPEARAWLERTRIWRAMGRDFDSAISGLVAAHAAYMECGDPRSAAQLQIYLGSLYTWTGAFERAREAIDDALRVARGLGSDYLEVWATYTDGKLAVEVAPLSSVRALLEDVIERSGATPRIRSGAQVYLGIAALRGEELELAERQARSVLAGPSAPAVELGARAVLVRALLGRQERARALPEAEALGERLAEVGTLVEFETLVRIALAEAALARGDRAAAAGFVAGARTELEARAATLADPLRRSQLATRPHLNARVLELSRELGAA